MKKLLSVLLAIVMVCGTMTLGFTTAFAAETQSDVAVGDNDNPAVSIEVLNDYTLTLQENQDGYYDLHYNFEIEDFDGEYFKYNYNSISEAELLITYKDGSTKTAHPYDEIDGNTVDVVDKQYSSPWLPNSENYLTIKYMDVETNIPVIITPDRVASIEIIKPMDPLFENDNGYFTTDSNGEEYFCYEYYTPDVKTADVKINYSDGTSKIAKIGDYVDDGYISYHDNQYYNHWKLGSDNYIEVTFMSRKVNMPVTIIETPLESITIDSAPTREYYLGDESYNYWNGIFQPTDLTGLKFTVKYKDGRTETYTDKDVDYDHTKIGNYRYNIGLIYDKKVGANTVTFKYMGFQTEYDVTVLEDVLSSVEVIKLPEKPECTQHYDPDWRGAELKFNYLDGTSKIVTLTDDNLKYGYTNRNQIKTAYVSFELDNYECIIYSNYYYFSESSEKSFSIEYMGKELGVEGIEYRRDKNVSDVEIENFSMSAKDMVINITNQDGSKEQIVLDEILYNQLSKYGSRIVFALTDKGVIGLEINNPNDIDEDGVVVQVFNKYLTKSSIKSYAKTTGDSNGDGVVDVLDAIEIQKFAAEKIPMTDEQKEFADVNKDGFVDVLDAVMIQKYAVGKITEFTQAA